MEQGREASGATANGGSARIRASRELARTVERGKNPEDGTDEGLAILVLPVWSQGHAGGYKGHPA